MWRFVFLIILCLTVHSSQHAVESSLKLDKIINSFTYDIYQKTIKGENGNVVISPFSVHSVLTMTLFGATEGSKTKTEMLNGLKFPQNQTNKKIAESYEKSIQSFEGNDNLKTANKIYIKEGFTIKPRFQELVTKSFKSEAESIDFTQSNEASETINKWVEDQTNNKIKNLISPASCHEETKMILVNTVYFKGLWQYEFKDSFPSRFYVSENESVLTDFMSLEQTLLFGRSDDFDVTTLELPYRDSDVSMYIILPNKRTGLTELEEKLGGVDILDICRRSLEDYTKVAVVIPKFKIEYEEELDGALRKMGMNEMFTNDAEFSNLIEDPVKISTIKHKAIIEVDEKGTVAATGSYGEVIEIRSDDTQFFFADHPFLFFLVSGESDNILFMGRVVRF